MGLTDKDIERIEKIIGLFQQGLITREELEASRKAILEAATENPFDNDFSDIERPNTFLEDPSLANTDNIHNEAQADSKSLPRLRVQDDDNFEGLEEDRVTTVSRRPTDNLGYSKINQLTEEIAEDKIRPKTEVKLRPKVSSPTFGTLKSVSQDFFDQETPDAVKSLKKTLGIFATVGIVIIVITAGIIHFGNKNQLNSLGDSTESSPLSGPRKTNSVASAPSKTEVENHYSSLIKPIFGPLAVKNCQEQCPTDSKPEIIALCNEGCQQYGFAEFITNKVNDHSPQGDTKTIIESCKQGVSEITPDSSYENWKNQVSENLLLLKTLNNTGPAKNFAEAKARFIKIRAANRKITIFPNLSPENSQLTKMLVFATCLKSHLALAEMGRTKVSSLPNINNKDYYQNFTKILSPISEKVDESIIARAKTF